MTLRIDHLELHDFRSYERFSLDGIGPLTVLYGPNAAGKTNVIEGVQLLTAQTSFRHPTVSQLIRMGSSVARLAAHATDGNRVIDLALSLSEGKKRYELNGKAKRAVDLRGIVPSVTFTPDDLALVKGSHAGRRATLDALGAQLSRNHYLIHHDYEKVLKHKNALLRDEAPEALVRSINDMVVKCGAQLTCYRVALFERVAAATKEYYEDIAPGEKLEAQYIPSWLVSRETDDTIACATGASPSRDEAREALETALNQRFYEEVTRRRSLVGPHADHIVFTIDGQDASLFASQGQQRSIVLAYKLAEATVVESVLGQKPVLLLDDVMSELDERRRRALVSFILQDIQTFITTANLDYFAPDLLAQAQVVRLAHEKRF